MSVESFEPKELKPDQVTIALTDAATAHIADQIARQGGSHIRLGIEESGCNGYRYQLSTIDAPAADDQVLAEADGWRLYVRERDLPFVNGTEIDLEVSGLNRALRFSNPNAESHCGCGESFSVA